MGQLRSRKGDDAGGAGEVSATPTYPPLSDVRKNLKVVWYRCPIGKKLGPLMQRSDLQGFIQAGGHFALWLCTGYLTYHCWEQSWWLELALSMFLHGTVGSCFLFGCHEMGHGTVFKTKWLNRAGLYLFSTLSWWDPFDYALSHTYHHKYTQFEEGDRENVFPIEPCLDPWVLFQMLTCNLTLWPSRVFGKGGLIAHVYLFGRAALGLGPGSLDIPNNEWLIALHDDQPNEAKTSVTWSQFMLVFHAAVIAASVYTGCWIMPFIVSYHSFCANWLRFAMGMCQHCGLRGNVPDFRKSVRSITLDPVSEYLYWSMNWHTEHHMFANVPCYNLKALHYAVADDMPVPRTLFGAWREMLDIHKKQQADPDFEFDTPLPATAGTTRTHEDAVGADSIGGLAPTGLSAE